MLVWRPSTPARTTDLDPAAGARRPQCDMVDPHVDHSTREPIHALLIDDHEDWARLIATKVERESDRIEVTVGTDPTEALTTLGGDRTIDCLIADYQMPQMDGIALLKHVRDNGYTLPFILVTAAGSEDIAATAIEAGVTDYIVKSPRVSQTAQFIKKIESAVQQHRLQRIIAESEQRYRTVTEQSRDAIGIVRNGALVFCNQRMQELTGEDRAELGQGSFVDRVVSRDDRDMIHNALTQWESGSKDDQLYPATLIGPDGAERRCEIVGQPITYEGSDAALVSIRDITVRKRRERELEWERDLNRGIQTALVRERTRENFERRAVEHLKKHGYGLVWIAEIDESIVPRITIGAEGYVDRVTSRAGDDNLAAEPCVAAARDREPQFVQDFASLPGAEWIDDITQSGYRSGAGIPLRYNDVSYGILAVYHPDAGRFDRTERRLLTELADTIAFAVHSLEAENTLAMKKSLTARLTIEDERYYLNAIVSDHPFDETIELVVHGTVPNDDEGVIQYVSAAGDSALSADAIEAAIASHAAVDSVTRITDEPPRFQVVVLATVPEGILAARGIIVHNTRISNTGATLSVDVPRDREIRPLLSTLDDAFGEKTLDAIFGDDQRPSSEQSSGADLTDKQAIAIEAAYHGGYFERPRKRSATEIAESLGISHATYLQHLRVAQQKIFTQRFH